jgi:hypothetical protein
MYETGTDLVPQNMATARGLYAAAASHGMKEAADRLKALASPDIPSPPAPVTTPTAPTP